MPLDERDKIAHLLRRAGFAARPEEIEAGVARGLQATVDRLVEFEGVADNLGPPPAGLDYNVTVNNATIDPPRGYTENVIGWWLNAMIRTNRPLQEKMVLFWHSLFATAVQNVDPSIRQVYLQNQLFRGNFNPLLPSQRRIPEDSMSPFPMGNFRNMLMWLARDPAMGYWLDNYLNTQKDREVGTNENFARELLELFSLGVQDVVAAAPNYTEADVRQASGVLTGWSVYPFNTRNPGQHIEGLPNNFPRWFTFYPASPNARIRHDPGPYAVLGVAFSSSGGDTQGRRLFDVIVQHKNPGQSQSACGRFIGYRLFKFFGYDDPEPEVVNALADIFDGRNGNQPTIIRNLLRAMFTPGNVVSEAFYSDKAFQSHVKSPTEYLVGAYRLLRPEGMFVQYETAGEPTAQIVSGEISVVLNALRQMGQLVFFPPDVSGWDEGLNWINTTFGLGRYNYASLFSTSVQMRVNGQPQTVQALTTAGLRSLLNRNGARTPDQVVDFFTGLLWQVPASSETRTTLVNYLTAGPNEQPGGFSFNLASDVTIDNKVRGLVHLIMSAPEYQLS